MKKETSQFADVDEIEEAVIDYWGKECKDYDKTCHLCAVWKEWNRIKCVVSEYKLKIEKKVKK